MTDEVFRVTFVHANKIFFTMLADGTIELGEGLSADEATQRVAALLAKNYSALHQQQADEIARLNEIIAPFADVEGLGKSTCVEDDAQLVSGYWADCENTKITFGHLRKVRDAAMKKDIP